MLEFYFLKYTLIFDSQVLFVMTVKKVTKRVSSVNISLAGKFVSGSHLVNHS